MRKNSIIGILMAASFLLMVIPIVYKFTALDYSLQSIIPQESYSITMEMRFTGNGDDLVVRTFLPKDTGSQEIYNFSMVSEGMNYRERDYMDYARGNWNQYNAQGDYLIKVHFNASIEALNYQIDPQLPLLSSIPEHLNDYLNATENIQVGHPEIHQLALELSEGEERLLPVLENIFNYIMDMDSKPFKGTTDALTAYRLQEASCNGKSRLFVALTRNLGIPSRLVGGLILNPGTKRTSHQWLEIYIGGYWVPMDPLNGHFAGLPNNYLTLYKGDEVLFSHSRNIGFDYHFDIRRETITNPQIGRALRQGGQRRRNLVAMLINGGMSQDILQFLLVIPFAVVIVVLFKNVIGIKTYGTFLPALMAMAITGTGLSAGILAFSMVLFLTVILRYPLEKLGILHTPKLAIMMLGVILSLVSISALSVFFEWEGFSALNSAAVFPIAILTITSERIALTIAEEGIGKSISIMAQTLIVVACCYLLIQSVALKALVLVFPELLFGALILNLWMGHWTGIRVMEFFRFRSILFKRESP